MPPFGELMFVATMSFTDLASIEKTEKSSAKPSACQVEALGIDAQIPANSLYCRVSESRSWKELQTTVLPLSSTQAECFELLSARRFGELS